MVWKTANYFSHRFAKIIMDDWTKIIMDISKLINSTEILAIMDDWTRREVQLIERDRRSVIEEEKEKERKADKSHHEGESRITDEQDYKNSSLTRCLQKIKSTNQFTWLPRCTVPSCSYHSLLLFIWIVYLYPQKGEKKNSHYGHNSWF